MLPRMIAKAIPSAILAVAIALAAWLHRPRDMSSANGGASPPADAATAETSAKPKPNILSVILGTSGALALVGTIATQFITNRNEEAERLAGHFTEAITHLASGETQLRMAGVYELGGLARESEPHRRVARKILAGNLRILAPGSEGAGATPEAAPAANAPVIRAIVDVISELPGSDGCADEQPDPLNLVGVNLRNQDLTEANLSGQALRDALLMDAVLRGAKLCRADLSRANLSGADLDRADLSGALLPDADLSNAMMVSANLTGAEMQRASLLNSHLIGADFSDADLYEANLSGAFMTFADFSSARLSIANLSDSILDGANFERANLGGADLSDTLTRRANFSSARLESADLSDAILDGANFEEAVLDGANLSGANLTDVLNLTVAQVNSANWDESTQLPPELYDSPELEPPAEGTPIAAR